MLIPIPVFAVVVKGLKQIGPLIEIRRDSRVAWHTAQAAEAAEAGDGIV